MRSAFISSDASLFLTLINKALSAIIGDRNLLKINNCFHCTRFYNKLVLISANIGFLSSQSGYKIHFKTKSLKHKNTKSGPE